MSTTHGKGCRPKTLNNAKAETEESAASISILSLFRVLSRAGLMKGCLPNTYRSECRCQMRITASAIWVGTRKS
jgi:hypothetical protein